MRGTGKDTKFAQTFACGIHINWLLLIIYIKTDNQKSVFKLIQ